MGAEPPKKAEGPPPKTLKGTHALSQNKSKSIPSKSTA